MPHALLLSPDDQAVAAITGVLEEMCVGCERPLDGVTAAQKLTARNFDLVLVDCENLAAAKLIFDVCRRGNNGHSPVPIAIVDGRAGLPTAFRLGAELILTKPVAKDQARTTIRTAVSRVRKEVGAGDPAVPLPSLPIENEVESPASATSQVSTYLAMAARATGTHEMTAPTTAQAATGETTTAAATTTQIATGEPVNGAEKSAQPARATAAGAGQQHSLADSVRPVTRKSPPPEASATSTPVVDKSGAAKSTEDSAKVQVKSTVPKRAPLRPSEPKRNSTAVNAFLGLVIAAGGLYGAWMYEPGFRSLAQSQIDRAVVLIGMGLPPAPAAPRVATSKAWTGIPTLASGNSDPMSSASSAVSVVSPTGSGSASAKASPLTPVASTPAARAGDSTAPAVVTSGTTKEATDRSTPDSQPREGNSEIVLSSKGAEKRLEQSVPPKYPVGTANGADGTVVLKARVDETGRVIDLQPVEGAPALASAAVQAVKQWRYRPYVRDGKTQPFQTVVIVDFQRP